MAGKKPVTASETPPETPWVTAHEARLLLGGISRQRLFQLKIEHQVPTLEENGVMKYAETALLDVRDKLGIGDTGDPGIMALNVLRDALESSERRIDAITKYVDLVQSSEREVVKLLRDENESLRTMRAKEQEAHLAAMVATQEALDASAERNQVMQQAEGAELRRTMAVDYLLTKIGPKLMAQWEQSGNSNKLLGLLRGLTHEQVEALKALVSDDERKAIDELRAAPVEEKQRVTEPQATEPNAI